MSAIHQVLLAGSGAGYQIANSLRLRASNSAYLSRTFGVPTDGKKFTLSWWMKRGTVGSAVSILSGINVSSTFSMQFSAQTTNSDGDYFRVANPNAGTTYLYTDAVFRDPSAWYHFVFVFDSANATANDRAILYCNGTRLSATVSVTLNATSRWNENGATARIGLGGAGFATVKDYFDGHKANFYMIDGQALTPSSFGQTDATTGVWVPKAYTGTFGTNGFFLQFKDATSTTTIGYDTSGNSNNFTTSGISVTSGVTFDQMTDTPTTNFSTMNPIASHTSVGTFAAANMQWSYGAGAYYPIIVGSAAINSKSYWEVTVTSVGGAAYIGIILASQQIKGTEGTNNTLASAGCWSYDNTGKKNNNNAPGSGTAYGSTYTTGDVIGVTYDPSTTTLTFYKNNVSQGSAYTNVTSGDVYAFVSGISGADFAVNFGQRPFSYTPPTGFKALSTANITSTAVATSGSFTGNAAADGPFVWTNGNPATLSINGNAVTFGTHADKTAGGFKLRSSSSSYNASGSNTWSATAGKRFVQSKKPNNAQTN